MKAISLHQPWASLVARGIKTIETRSWRTNHKGWLAIHATKTRKHMGVLSELLEKAGLSKLTALLPAGDESWPIGAVVGAAYLVRSLPTTDPELLLRLHRQEKPFGDYSPGRFAWEFGAIIRLKEPIECRGWQGLWNLPENAASVVEEAIKGGEPWYSFNVGRKDPPERG